MGLMVLTRKVKYRRWQTHTTAMQILPMGAFFIQRKPIAMTAVTIAMILHFVPAVMAFFLNKAVKMHFVCAFLRNESVVY